MNKLSAAHWHKSDSGLLWAFSALGVISVFVSARYISLPIIIAVVLCFTAAAAAIAFRMTMRTITGIFLLLIPLQWFAIALLQLNGVQYYELISALKEVFLVLAILWFAYREQRFRVTIPDFILAAAIVIALLEQIYHTDIRSFRDDWEWVLPYMLGRVVAIPRRTVRNWARGAVWMCVGLAIFGGWEVLVLGPQFRLLLLSIVEGDLKLPPPFFADGYDGLRAASTMVSPLSFSAVCMVALIFWWTFMDNPVPALLIAAGLVLTVTRSALLAAVIGVFLIGMRRHEAKRLSVLILALIASLAVAIPLLHLDKFVTLTFTPGADTSLVGHQNSVVNGFDVMLAHPLGTGAGSASPRSLAREEASMDIESAYITIAVEYGIPVGILYVGFFVACSWTLFGLRDNVGYAAFSVLVGFALLLAVGPLHQDLPVACWIWVPVGMAVARSSHVIPTTHRHWDVRTSILTTSESRGARANLMRGAE